jgi:hypothetical protein
MPNSIHNLDTFMCESDAGEVPVIVMGLDLPDAETAEPFLDHVIETFKNQRMCSPPDTAHMSVTLAGSLPAERFRELWARRVAADPVLRHFTSMMVFADVLHIAGKELLDRASLVGAAEPDG